MLTQNKPLQAEPQMSLEKYPVEVRKLGRRATQIFDTVQSSFIEKGSSWAEAYFHASMRTPEMYRAEQRRRLARFEPM